MSNDNEDEGYVFPDEDDNLTAYTGGIAQLMISSSLMQNISKHTYIVAIDLALQFTVYSLSYIAIYPIVN